jgi:hypothetical protein
LIIRLDFSGLENHAQRKQLTHCGILLQARGDALIWTLLWRLARLWSVPCPQPFNAARK